MVILFKPRLFPSEEVSCCDYQADFGAPATDCSEECEEPGLEECSVVVCYSDIETYTKGDCDPTSAGSGQLTALQLETDPVTTQPKTGVRFFAKDDSQLAEYEETVNDNNGIDATTTITGQGKSDPNSVCWMKAYINRKVVRFMEDNCGRVRAYGITGNLKLTRWKDSTGTVSGDFVGIDYDFTSTKRGDFCYVDVAAMGFADNDAFFDNLLGL